MSKNKEAAEEPCKGKKSVLLGLDCNVLKAMRIRAPVVRARILKTIDVLVGEGLGIPKQGCC